MEREEINKTIIVPQFVIDWYFKHKNDLDYQISQVVLDIDRKDYADHTTHYTDFEVWFKKKHNSIETLIMMSIYGFEKEPDPTYYINFLRKNKDELSRDNSFLIKSLRNNVLFTGALENYSNNTLFKTKFTEDEINLLNNGRILFQHFSIPENMLES